MISRNEYLRIKSSVEKELRNIELTPGNVEAVKESCEAIRTVFEVLEAGWNNQLSQMEREWLTKKKVS